MASQLNHQNKPIVLSIGGSDPAGMAGIQMDLKVQTAFDVHSLFAITANTAQNNQKVISINPVCGDVLKQQLEAIAFYPIRVIKVGLLNNLEQARVIADFVISRDLPMILDPVLASTSDFQFFDNQNLSQLTQILLPQAYLVTPNVIEASLLTGAAVNNFQDIEKAAARLISLGAKNVLIKGGHLVSKVSQSVSQEYAQDYFLGEKQSFWLSSKRQTSKNSRGTGCALASSIASCLALGYNLDDAVVIGKMAINQGLRNGYAVANEKGPVFIKKFPDQSIDLPCLSDSVESDLVESDLVESDLVESDAAEVDFNREKFPQCNEPKLGLYPIVDRAHWITKFTANGVSTIQLRIKDLTGETLENEIKQAIIFARQTQCRLFINDYWQLAIKHKAYGVHLGQEDLHNADLNAIHKAGLRLGLSSHCYYEVARAIQIKPSYIAFGPVFHTNSKKMPWIPGGIEGLKYWRKVIDYPLVAIGGINLKNINEVIATGVDSVAMISAITEVAQPEVVVKTLISFFK